MRRFIASVVCFVVFAGCAHGDDIRVHVRESRPGLFERMRANRTVWVPAQAVRNPERVATAATAATAATTLVLPTVSLPPAPPEPRKELRVLIEKK